MFSIGDKILYPMHGAGIIEKIDTKEVLGVTRDYFILKLAAGNLDVMVPVEMCEEVGVRHIIEAEDVQEVYDTLKSDSTEMPKNWNRRLRENMELLKSGNILKVAQVVRNLIRFDYEKKLSTGEKKMLNNARQILESEVALATGMDIESTRSKVENIILEKEMAADREQL
ncbi:MAG: CarD family transcriptional regulator [Peptostreptococcaceae bacterium]|nr:CarD family transcriptional regulator [Peptostreptococcaceae bacterium]MDY5738717.1 CarD family transcriptional regulator [Anaerovoracaceae bacterium]